MKDDGDHPGRAVANLREMRDQVFVNVGLLGSAILNAAKDDIVEYKLPIVTPYGNPAIWAKQPRAKLPCVFVNYPDYADEAELLTRFAAEKLGAKKVGVFYPNDDYGKGGLEGVNRALTDPREARGGDRVHQRLHSPRSHARGVNAVRVLWANKAADFSYVEALPTQVFQPHF